jgi:hypothetical protein
MQTVMPRNDNKATKPGRLAQFLGLNESPNIGTDLRGHTHRDPPNA